MSNTTRTLLTLFSTAVAVAALVLWLDVFQVVGSDVTALLARLRWWTVPVIFALLTAHVALSAIRWGRIEVTLGGKAPPFQRAFLTGGLALGLGTFLPGPIANVACRGLSNRLAGASGVRGAVGGGLDQVADIAVVLLFIAPATIGFLARSPVAYLASGALAAIIGWAVADQLSRGRPRRIIELLSRKYPQVLPFFASGVLGEVYLLTLARLFCLTAITVMIHVASGAATFGSVLVAVPLVTLAISVAMLPGAFGISEWSFTGVLTGFGIPVDQVMMFVLANRLVLTTLSLAIGAISAAWAMLSLGRRRMIVC